MSIFLEYFKSALLISFTLRHNLNDLIGRRREKALEQEKSVENWKIGADYSNLNKRNWIRFTSFDLIMK